MRSPELGYLPANSTGIGFFFWILFIKIPGKTGMFLVQPGVQNAKDGFSGILLVLDPGFHFIKKVKSLLLLRVGEV